MMALTTLSLKEWLFCMEDSPAAKRAVTLPHTWSVEPACEDYTGCGLYECTLPAGCCAPGQRAVLHFNGAYRDTQVWVNGREAGMHMHSGYTPFEVEITHFLFADAENTLRVRVDNRFSETALPCGTSFDWANDGGLYRPVSLYLTGPVRIGVTRLSARPFIPPYGTRQNGGSASFSFSTVLDASQPCTLRWSLRDGETVLCKGTEAGVSGTCRVEQTLSDIVYWHFDHPKLYTLRLSVLDAQSRLSDEKELSVGFREILSRGEKLYLNGEPVRLPGMEWMPGSDPDIGAAETPAQMEKMLRLLRDAHCVITRFHWQQDEWVYDWCDRNGLLVQEEIPFWGPYPDKPTDALWQTAKNQLQETIDAHGTHPSIFSWGVGNELRALDPDWIEYIRRAIALAHQLDPDRLSCYVSNTVWENPEKDATACGDVLLVNDYIGTWHVGYEQAEAWSRLTQAHPGRAIIPAEFGLCEPAFSGGDARREQIFLEKLACYRAIPAVAGTISFCLNDYRTHMGEDGEGRLRRRVHGSTDWRGNPKPSYATVRREYAPLIIERAPGRLILTCRNDLPSYTVQGWKVQVEGILYDLPTLLPGASHTIENPLFGAQSRVQLLPPNLEQ